MTFPSFLTNPFSPNSFVTATIPTTPASSGTISIVINPGSCPDVGSHSFSITMTDSINTDVIISVNINVLDPLPSFASWNSVSPSTITVGSLFK